MKYQSHQTTAPPQPSRKLCHFCGKMRSRVVNFNMPAVIVLPSGRTKVSLCEYCILTLDEIATDTIKHPNRKA